MSWAKNNSKAKVGSSGKEVVEGVVILFSLPQMSHEVKPPFSDEKNNELTKRVARRCGEEQSSDKPRRDELPRPSSEVGLQTPAATHPNHLTETEVGQEPYW